MTQAEPNLPTPQKDERFLTLFLAEQRRLFQFVSSLLADVHAAEDVMQQASLVLWRKFDQFQPGTSFFAWASRVAYLEALDYKKRARRSADALDPAVLELLATDAVQEAGWLERQMALLEECLKKLPERDQSLIRQRYEHGESGRAMAAANNRSVAAIYKTMERIRSTLLQCMQRGQQNEARQEGAS
ncbi:MAG: sigma-70 family RNA polymerase sigma factor [Planctomycetes bacterium]|nr:sigma-70 family RNA polymerase sigma factor [Planctomycetota bacterium]